MSDAEQDITSRIVTTPMLDQNPPSFRVSWVLWDSSFRSTGLRPGDRIIAVNGKDVARPATLEEMQRALPSSIGQYDEPRFWASAGAHSGDPLTLTVRRRRVPGEGWEALEFQGKLLATPEYSTPEGRRAVGPGGPDSMEHDGFNDSWGSWYEDKLIPKFTWLLDGGWQQGSLNSRFELRQHNELKAQVDYLVQHYPGSFAASVQSDWQAIYDSLNGAKVELSDADLQYRRAEDEKTGHVKDAGAAAFAAFQKSIEAQTMETFPALNPVRGDAKTVAGKYVVLPPIGNRDWLDQGGRTFFAFGSSSDGYYFAEAEREDAQAMLLAVQRYRRLVSPAIYESYAVIGRITEEATLKIISGQGFYGLEIAIAAALVGDSMFVDVSKRQGTLARFAGEEMVDRPMHAVPPASASPREIMEAFFAALKTGDIKLWRALFADWRVAMMPEGPLIYPHDTIVDDNNWEAARRSLATRVYDMHVVWTGEPREVTTGKEFVGAPRVEEVDVEIEHVGLFDGEYRVFRDVTVNRLWQLQRYNNGPWRIVTVQSI